MDGWLNFTELQLQAGFPLGLAPPVLLLSQRLLAPKLVLLLWLVLPLKLVIV